jgi:hypothetical protein
VIQVVYEFTGNWLLGGDQSPISFGHDWGLCKFGRLEPATARIWRRLASGRDVSGTPGPTETAASWHRRRALRKRLDRSPAHRAVWRRRLSDSGVPWTRVTYGRRSGNRSLRSSRQTGIACGSGAVFVCWATSHVSGVDRPTPATTAVYPAARRHRIGQPLRSDMRSNVRHVGASALEWTAPSSVPPRKAPPWAEVVCSASVHWRPRKRQPM